MSTPSSLRCVFYHLRHGLQKQKEPRRSKSWFLGPILRFRGLDNFSSGCVTKQQGFTTCCLSLWCRRCVESAVESNDVLVTCFCAVSLSGTHRSSMITVQKSRLWRPRKPLACGPKHCQFSRTVHGCLPTFCDTRESKVPAILRDWQQQDAERAVL